MDHDTEFLTKCPKCNKDLELKQMHLNKAVYICTDLNCSYPSDGDNVACVFRRLKDINNPNFKPNLTQYNESAFNTQKYEEEIDNILFQAYDKLMGDNKIEPIPTPVGQDKNMHQNGTENLNDFLQLDLSFLDFLN